MQTINNYLRKLDNINYGFQNRTEKTNFVQMMNQAKRPKLGIPTLAEIKAGIKEYLKRGGKIKLYDEFGEFVGEQ